MQCPLGIGLLRLYVPCRTAWRRRASSIGSTLPSIGAAAWLSRLSCTSRTLCRGPSALPSLPSPWRWPSSPFWPAAASTLMSSLPRGAHLLSLLSHGCLSRQQDLDYTELLDTRENHKMPFGCLENEMGRFLSGTLDPLDCF